ANPVAVYSRAKYAADLVLSTLENVGIARIRMPIDDRKHRANMIDKLVAYPQVVDVNNSATVVPDMILAFRQLLEKKATGIFHCTNPGAITHREILALYNKYVEPIAEKEWIREGELVDFGLVAKKRSNNIMQSINLAKYGISMRPIKEAVEEAMKNYKK
ncbi:hypothetical protein KBC40_03675, partial [Patescibacteria group bacterium]|nr:hypothetical protein [Patescibacteria group bacterium]